MKNKFVFALLISLLFSCNQKPLAPEPESEQEEKPVVYHLTLIAAGDNLFHDTIINNHKQGSSHNFSPIYSEIKDLVQNADLAFINQETVMAGASFGYSGYPRFNTPQSLARTLADTGFNIVNVANNHTMDMGRSGLYATLDLLDTIEEFTVIGARKTGDSFRIITKNNISLGFLSYTYGLNGFTLPQGEPNLVSLINRDKMTQEINALRPLCDFLIVSMHWGEEYKLIEPGREQIDLANLLASLNVDLIIGHHPHVLQQVEILERPDGKTTLCFYSLGNFVSHQIRKERILGGIMLVTFSKEDESLSISNSGLLPVVTHFERNYTNTKVYPYYSYKQETMNRHFLKFADSEMDYGYFYSVLFRLNTKLIMHNPFGGTGW